MYIIGSLSRFAYVVWFLYPFSDELSFVRIYRYTDLIFVRVASTGNILSGSGELEDNIIGG